MDTPAYGSGDDDASTIRKVEILRDVPLFQDLGRDYLFPIAQHAQEVSIQAGEAVVREGEPGRELGLLIEGAARVEHNGRVLSQLGAGDFFGEMAILDEEPRSATVVASSASRVMFLDSTMFRALLAEAPGFETKLLKTMSVRLRERGHEPVE